MNDERIKLLMDFGLSEENARKLAAEMEKLKTSVKTTADTYEVLMGEMGTYEVLERRVAEATTVVATATTQQGMSLAQVEKLYYGATAGATALRGTSGMGGQGLLGASYAMQDFIAVYSGGGGFGRALGSMANNVTMVAMGLGAGVGLAGALTVVTQLAAAGIPVISSFFGGFSGKQKDEALEGLKELEAEIRRVEKAYKELRDQPTEAESEQAKRLKEYLGQRPNAERVRRAYIQATAGAAPDIGMMSEAERAQLEQHEATIRDFDVRRARGERLGVAEENEERGARMRRALMMNEANRRRADQAIADAMKAGPAGDQARQGLIDALKVQAPGLAADLERPPMTAAERQHQFQAQAQARKQVEHRIQQDQQRRNKELEGQAKDEARNEQEQRKQDREWLAKDRQRIQAEEARVRRGDERNRREFAIDRRDAERLPHRRMEQATSAISQQMGMGRPTAVQANEMADAALREMRNGASAEQAAMMAVLNKIRAIQQDAAQRRVMWQRMQMGLDMGAPGR